MDYLPIGIEAIDRDFGLAGDGLPVGTCITFTAPPANQLEPLFQQICRERPTFYITTTRTEEDVNWMLSQNRANENVFVESVGVSEKISEETESLIKRADKTCNIILDPIDPIERLGPERTINFYRNVRQHIRDIDAMLFVLGTKADDLPAGRAATEQLSDIVLDVEQVRNNVTSETFMTPLKNRFGPVPDPKKLDYRIENGFPEVKVDTSRYEG